MGADIAHAHTWYADMAGLWIRTLAQEWVPATPVARARRLRARVPAVLNMISVTGH